MAAAVPPPAFDAAALTHFWEYGDSMSFLAGNVFICHVFPSLHLQTWRVVSATCRRHVFGHVADLATLHVG